MVAVFMDDHEVIIVGVNADGTPMDPDGLLFGENSGRDIDTFERIDSNFDKGQTVHVKFTRNLVVH